MVDARSSRGAHSAAPAGGAGRRVDALERCTAIATAYASAQGFDQPLTPGTAGEPKRYGMISKTVPSPLLSPPPPVVP